MKISDLLQTPSDWTKGSLARDKDNNPVLPNDPSATSWCLLGAIYKCPSKDWRLTRALLTWEIGGDRFSAWNDVEERTFEEVRDVVLRMEMATETMTAERLIDCCQGMLYFLTFRKVSDDHS